MSAHLLVSEKFARSRGLVQESKVWEVPISDKYPEGVRYRLALTDPLNGKVLLLLDNHWPKGHHVHEGGSEREYHFEGIGNLLYQFRRRIPEVERNYYESKKNKN